MSDDLMIPPEIESKYEGRWIAWDTEATKVLADGATMDEVVDSTAAERDAGRLIWYHNCLPHDVLVVGGIW